MEIFQSIFLGIVQGATEFLPVSSSGHLFLAEHWLGLVPNMDLMIVTHVATLGAVLLVFWREAWDLIVGFVKLCLSLYKKSWGPGTRPGLENGWLALKLGVATLVTIGVALFIEPWFGELLNLKVVATTLIITGLLIVIAEKCRRGEEVPLSWPIVIGLGIVQGLAVVPGISRSGLTIAFLILLGLNRRKAAEYSFLLSIPTILAAGIFLILESGISAITVELLLAALAAFITALLMIYSMLKLVEKHWIWFAPYCVGLGLFLVLL